MKVVINRFYGGFGVSAAAVERLLALGADPATVETIQSKAGLTYHRCDLERHDKRLVQVVEELGPKANGTHAKLVVVEIPDGIEYEIEEYDGMEQVAEVHRTWS